MLNSYLSITYVFPRHRPKQPPSRGSTAPKSVMGIQRDIIAVPPIKTSHTLTSLCPYRLHTPV